MGSFKADVKVQSFSRPQPFKADVKVQSVAGDPKLVGQRVVIYGDKTRPLLDGLRGRVVSVARVYSAETRLTTVRLDTPLVLLETDSPQHEVEAEASRLLTVEEYEQLQKLERESAYVKSTRWQRFWSFSARDQAAVNQQLMWLWPARVLSLFDPKQLWPAISGLFSTYRRARRWTRSGSRSTPRIWTGGSLSSTATPARLWTGASSHLSWRTSTQTCLRRHRPPYRRADAHIHLRPCVGAPS